MMLQAIESLGGYEMKYEINPDLFKNMKKTRIASELTLIRKKVDKKVEYYV